MERSTPTGKSSFEFVVVPCVPCVRARRSCVGEREGLMLVLLEVPQHKCFTLRPCPSVVRVVPPVARLVLIGCPAGCPACPDHGV